MARAVGVECPAGGVALLLLIGMPDNSGFGIQRTSAGRRHSDHRPATPYAVPALGDRAPPGRLVCRATGECLRQQQIANAGRGDCAQQIFQRRRLQTAAHARCVAHGAKWWTSSKCFAIPIGRTSLRTLIIIAERLPPNRPGLIGFARCNRWMSCAQRLRRLAAVKSRAIEFSPAAPPCNPAFAHIDHQCRAGRVRCMNCGHDASRGEQYPRRGRRSTSRPLFGGEPSWPVPLMSPAHRLLDDVVGGALA